MKSHMGFPLTPRSMTLDDLELRKFEFLVNFAGLRRFRTQQQLAYCAVRCLYIWLFILYSVHWLRSVMPILQ